LRYWAILLDRLLWHNLVTVLDFYWFYRKSTDLYQLYSTVGVSFRPLLGMFQHFADMKILFFEQVFSLVCTIIIYFCTVTSRE